MRHAGYAWAVARGLLGTAAVVVGAATAVTIIAPAEAERGDARPSAEVAPGEASDSLCKTTTVRMSVAEGFPSAHYSLCDDEGNELLRVMYNRTGRVAVTWGDRFSVRAGCWAAPGGAYDLSVKQGEVEYRFEARPGVTTGFRVVNHRTNERDGLGVTPEGWIVRGPSILE